MFAADQVSIYDGFLLLFLFPYDPQTALGRTLPGLIISPLTMHEQFVESVT